MLSNLVPTEKMPEWFSYPNDFTAVIDDGLLNIGPWQILTGEWLLVRFEGLKKRFPGRQLVPFARRLDSDDVACWERDSPSEVRIIHDFAAPGWEQRDGYSSFEAWLRAAQLEKSQFETLEK